MSVNHSRGDTKIQFVAKYNVMLKLFKDFELFIQGASKIDR